MGVNYEERILALAERLDKKGVEYEKKSLFGDIDQLVFAWCDADIVCHFGSYGSKEGLFEIMGKELMTKYELKLNSVVGGIGIDEAEKRIVAAWNKHKKEAE